MESWTTVGPAERRGDSNWLALQNYYSTAFLRGNEANFPAGVKLQARYDCAETRTSRCISQYVHNARLLPVWHRERCGEAIALRCRPLKERNCRGANLRTIALEIPTLSSSLLDTIPAGPPWPEKLSGGRR